MDDIRIETMDDYKDEIEKSLKRLYVGDIVQGTVIGILDDQVLVDIGSFAEGIIKADELSNDPKFLIKEDIKEGDVINGLILRMDDGNGNLVLSKKKADDIVAWDELETLYKENSVVKVRVSQVVNGGVIAYLKGVRSFIPASLLSTEYVDNLQEWINREVEAKIITFDANAKKVVLSAKEVEKEKQYQIKRARLFEINKGDFLEGTVKKLMDFGAFVDLGGIDGLIRNQDMSWERIKHPSELVEIGQRVKVNVIDIDVNSEKITLALKDIDNNPINGIIKELEVGSITNGIVEKITNYGAFIKLTAGVEGLLHVSEISEKRITNPADVLSVGEEITIKIIDIKDGKISLSLKEAEAEKDKVLLDEYKNDEEVTTSLGTMLANMLGKK